MDPDFFQFEPERHVQPLVPHKDTDARILPSQLANKNWRMRFKLLFTVHCKSSSTWLRRLGLDRWEMVRFVSYCAMTIL